MGERIVFFGAPPIWHRSRRQQIEIDNSNCPSLSLLSSHLLPPFLPTNCPSAFGSPTNSRILQCTKSFEEFQRGFSRDTDRTQRSCARGWVSLFMALQPTPPEQPPLTRPLHAGSKRFPLLVPSLICCISFGVRQGTR